jgi:hypothetical protein
MLLFLLAALGTLGVGFVASYELSPEVRAWTRGFLEAVAAHHESDAHLAAASSATDPAVAVWHTHMAAVANQEAARRTSQVVKTSQTEPQRQAAGKSVVAVVEREDRIVAALAKLGVGQCGVRSYSHVTAQVKDALLARLHGEGMAVSGDNPWDIDTRSYGVKLRAVWDSSTSELRLIVTSGEGGALGLVTCSAIWGKIDPVLREVVGDRGPSVAGSTSW